MTPYRDPVAAPSRVPPPTLVLRDGTYWATIGMIVFLAGFCIVGVLLGYGVSVRCRREAPSAIATCHVWEPVTWTSAEFRGAEGALTVMELEEGDTALAVEGFRSIPLDPRHARAAAVSFDRFVTTPEAGAYSAWPHGRFLHAAGFLLAGVTCILVLGTFLSWHTVVIDAELDLLVVERRRVLRRPITLRRALSAIDAVSVEAVDDSDRHDLVLVRGSGKQAALRTTQAFCGRTKAAIESAIAAVKRAREVPRTIT